MRRVIGFLIFGLSALVGVASSAAAEGGAREISAHVSKSVAEVLGGDDGTGGSRCSWEEIHHTSFETGPDGSAETTSWPTRHVDGRIYYLYQVSCDDGIQEIEVPEIEATDLLPQALHDLKTARVPAPELEFIELDEGRAYARVPVDFRVRNAEPVSVTASLPAPFNVSLTVTATPATIHFTPGEPGGREITCSAAGAQAGYDASSPGECSYTYRNSSAIAPTATFTATASIDWAVSYRGSSGSGTQPGLTTSGSATIAVGEIQAVIVSP